jgi:hypothetical protein
MKKGNEVTSEKYFNRGTPALPQQSMYMIAYGAPRLLAAKSLGRIPGRILPTGPATPDLELHHRVINRDVAC